MKTMEDSFRSCWLVLLAGILLSALMMLTSCKHTEYITVEKVRTDTTYISKLQRDSVWLHDSIHVAEKGDTVKIHMASGGGFAARLD